MRAKARNGTESHSDSGGFDKKLIAYAVASGAALAAPAHASIIHYGGPPLTTTMGGSPLGVVVDGVDYYFNGSTDLNDRIFNNWWSPAGLKAGAGGLSGPLSAGQPVTGPFYTAAGSKNSPAGVLNQGVFERANLGTSKHPISGWAVTSVTGFVPNGVDTYLGLQLPVVGQTNYGWMLLDASLYGNTSEPIAQVEVLDYAYQSNGGPILAGQTTDTPEPSTLALFALGAVGVAAARRRAKRA